MPIYLRQFYYNKLADTKKKENEEADKLSRKTKGVSRPSIPRR